MPPLRWGPGCCCCTIWDFATQTDDDIRDFFHGVDWPQAREFDGILKPGEEITIRADLPSKDVWRVWLDIREPTYIPLFEEWTGSTTGSSVNETVTITGADTATERYRVRVSFSHSSDVARTRGTIQFPSLGTNQLWDYDELSGPSIEFDSLPIDDPSLGDPNGVWTITIETDTPDTLITITLLRVTVYQPGNFQQSEPFEFTLTARNPDDDGWTVTHESLGNQGPLVCEGNPDFELPPGSGDVYNYRYLDKWQMWLDYDPTLGYADRGYNQYGYAENDQYYRWWFDDQAMFKQPADEGPFYWSAPNVEPYYISQDELMVFSWEEELGLDLLRTTREYDPAAGNNILIMFPWTVDLDDLTVKLKNDGSRMFEMFRWVGERIEGLEPADSYDCVYGYPPSGTPVNESCDFWPAPCPQLDDMRLIAVEVDKPEHPTLTLPDKYRDGKVACNGSMASYCTESGLGYSTTEQEVLVRSREQVGTIDFPSPVIETTKTYVVPVPPAKPEWRYLTEYTWPPLDFVYYEYDRGSVSQIWNYQFSYLITRIQGGTKATLSAALRLFYIPDETYLSYRAEGVVDGFLYPRYELDCYTDDPDINNWYAELTKTTEWPASDKLYMIADRYEFIDLIWNDREIDLCDWVPGYRYRFENPDTGAENPLPYLATWIGEWRYDGTGTASEEDIRIAESNERSSFFCNAGGLNLDMRLRFLQDTVDLSTITIDVELFDPVVGPPP